MKTWDHGLLGQRVASLAEEAQGPGKGTVTWTQVKAVKNALNRTAKPAIPINAIMVRRTDTILLLLTHYLVQTSA